MGAVVAMRFVQFVCMTSFISYMAKFKKVWWRHMYARSASLNSIRFGTFNQCSCAWTSSIECILDVHELCELCEERRDVVVPRRRKHKPNIRIHHQLHPLDQMGGDTDQRCVTIVQPLQDER